eukprot:1839088-Pleurochrysis_carterae.AAC.1
MPQRRGALGMVKKHGKLGMLFFAKVRFSMLSLMNRQLLHGHLLHGRALLSDEVGGEYSVAARRRASWWGRLRRKALGARVQGEGIEMRQARVEDEVSTNG